MNPIKSHYYIHFGNNQWWLFNRDQWLDYVIATVSQLRLHAGKITPAHKRLRSLPESLERFSLTATTWFYYSDDPTVRVVNGVDRWLAVDWQQELDGLKSDRIDRAFR